MPTAFSSFHNVTLTGFFKSKIAKKIATFRLHAALEFNLQLSRYWLSVKLTPADTISSIKFYHIQGVNKVRDIVLTLLGFPITISLF